MILLNGWNYEPWYQFPNIQNQNNYRNVAYFYYQGAIIVGMKKLKWSYNDDFFSKKSEVFEKVFKEFPEEEVEIHEIDKRLNIDSLVVDIEYYETLRDSIRNKLFKLDDSVRVYTGHGADTTIGEEKRNNPFVGQRATYWG